MSISECLLFQEQKTLSSSDITIHGVITQIPHGKLSTLDSFHHRGEVLCSYWNKY